MIRASLAVLLPALWLNFAPPPQPVTGGAAAPPADVPTAPAAAPDPAPPELAPLDPAPPDPAPPDSAPPDPAPLDPAPPDSAPPELAPPDSAPPDSGPSADADPDAPITPTPTPSAAADAPITVTTRLTPEDPHIGDVLTLEVIVAYPQGFAINLPSSLDFSPLQRVEGREIEASEVESTGNDLRQRFTIALQYFDVGEAEVPAFPVTWVDAQDEVHTYLVEAHPFEIDSLLGNESDPQPRGEDPMISLEYPNLRLATIIWSVLAGIVVASVLATLLLLWRRREQPVVLPPPIPPHVIAYGELELLAKEREELIGAGAYQDYYLRLTDIAKRYLGGRFDFEASDRTTEEIQDLLRGQINIEPLDPKAVLTFLQDCDLVKFARLSPPEDEAREALELVRGMVDDSIQLTPVSPDAAPSNEGQTLGQSGPNAQPERTLAERPAPLPSDASSGDSETPLVEPSETSLVEPVPSRQPEHDEEARS